ncbi:hypothetical protein [Shinella zoogloeoides]|uniref:hypothetical protein n=1 Tax=Shinella zoogloeoides TaxID=352475 RepID=UPI00273F6F8F|nr:hypothetical protein [Shinella zoogloeoides]WLR92939.1 hypothetical protein Q9316_01645 [Shinella zoogloeoides]
MLFAEAARLALIETICPTSAIVTGEGFPTLAGGSIFDSRAARGAELDASRAFTPTVAVYTVESSANLRGPLSDASDREARAVLDIVTELSVLEGDADTTPLAENDPLARLVLAALTSQVRYLIEHAPSGRSFFRRFVNLVERIETKTLVVPELGLRLQSQTTRVTVLCDDDDFNVPAGELPEPIRSLLVDLPANSYARQQLLILAAAFAPQSLPDLEVARFETNLGVSGEGLPQN